MAAVIVEASREVSSVAVGLADDLDGLHAMIDFAGTAIADVILKAIEAVRTASPSMPTRRASAVSRPGAEKRRAERLD